MYIGILHNQTKKSVPIIHTIINNIKNFSTFMNAVV